MTAMFIGLVIFYSEVVLLVLATVLISATNAVVRKVFNYSSNGLLEIQWYLFSLIFLFCAGYTLKHNEHVRIDIVTGRLSPRARAAIDIFGTLFFLLPMATLIMWLSWPVFVASWNSGEVSANANGLVLWPARLLRSGDSKPSVLALDSISSVSAEMVSWILSTPHSNTCCSAATAIGIMVKPRKPTASNLLAPGWYCSV